MEGNDEMNITSTYKAVLIEFVTLQSGKLKLLAFTTDPKRGHTLKKMLGLKNRAFIGFTQQMRFSKFN